MGLARSALAPGILFTLPLWPQDVLEPMQLQQPFAKRASQKPGHFQGSVMGRAEMQGAGAKARLFGLRGAHTQCLRLFLYPQTPA